MILRKKYLFAALLGAAFTLTGSALLQRLYAAVGGELLGILFGAVNGSIWESAKTLLLPYLIWSVLEVMSLRLPLHRFTVVKALSLYALGGAYLLLQTGGVGAVPSAVLSVMTAFTLSVGLHLSPLSLRGWFAPAVAALFLFLALYFSLTPFPPHHPIFRDPATGMYGIIPRHFDYGAAALDTLYTAEKSPL